MSGWTPTYFEDGSEDGGLVDRGAVPAPVHELPLTLLDAHLGAPGHLRHVVLVQLAQLRLSRRQPLHLVADGLRADDVELRVLPHVEPAHAQVPVGGKETHCGQVQAQQQAGLRLKPWRVSTRLQLKFNDNSIPKVGPAMC